MSRPVNFDLIARRAQPHVRNQACRPGHDPWTCARCGARGEHAHLHGAEIGWGRFACESCYGVHAICKRLPALEAAGSVVQRHYRDTASGKDEYSLGGTP